METDIQEVVKEKYGRAAPGRIHRHELLLRRVIRSQAICTVPLETAVLPEEAMI
jgi:hypothetical protein